MKYFDFAFQTLVFAFVILTLGYSLISKMDFNDNLMVITCAAIVLGPWQMASSFISIIARSGFYKLKRLHFVISSAYLVILYFFNLYPSLQNNYIIFICLCVPFGLSIFYYYITCRWVFKIKQTSRFLAHINF